MKKKTLNNEDSYAVFIYIFNIIIKEDYIVGLNNKITIYILNAVLYYMFSYDCYHSDMKETATFASLSAFSRKSRQGEDNR